MLTMMTIVCHNCKKEIGIVEPLDNYGVIKIDSAFCKTCEVFKEWEEKQNGINELDKG